MPPPLSLSPLQWLGEVAISREFTMSSYFPRSLFKKHHQPAAARVRLRLLRCSHNRVHCLRNSERDSLPKKIEDVRLPARSSLTLCTNEGHGKKGGRGKHHSGKFPHTPVCVSVHHYYSLLLLYMSVPLSRRVCVSNAATLCCSAASIEGQRDMNDVETHRARARGGAAVGSVVYFLLLLHQRHNNRAGLSENEISSTSAVCSTYCVFGHPLPPSLGQYLISTWSRSCTHTHSQPALLSPFWRAAGVWPTIFSYVIHTRTTLALAGRVREEEEALLLSGPRKKKLITQHM